MKQPQKRDLSKEEWIAIGNQIKTARAAMHDVANKLCATARCPVIDTWLKIASKIDRAKSTLESTASHQHPDWDDRVVRVFYGDPIPEESMRT